MLGKYFYFRNENAHRKDYVYSCKVSVVLFDFT